LQMVLDIKIDEGKSNLTHGKKQI